MSPEQQQAMRAGRERARAARVEAQIERVLAYRRWLRAGADFHSMPAIPRDADFKAMRKHNQRRG